LQPSLLCSFAPLPALQLCTPQPMAAYGSLWQAGGGSHRQGVGAKQGGAGCFAAKQGGEGLINIK